METSFLLGRENVKKKLAVSSYFIFRSSLGRALTWLRRCKFLESLNVHKKKIFSTVRSVFTEVCCVIKHPKIYKTGKFLAVKITEIFLMFFSEKRQRTEFFSLLKNCHASDPVTWPGRWSTKIQALSEPVYLISRNWWFWYRLRIASFLGACVVGVWRGMEREK